MLQDWNREVMARRKALPWVELTSGTLDVKYRGTESQLPCGAIHNLFHTFKPCIAA